MKREAKASALAAVGLPVVWAASGAWVCENALRVAPQWRSKAPPKVAGRVAGDGTWRDVTIAASDGVELRAWWFEPVDPHGVVVLLHGATDSRQDMMGHARMLLRNGYRVLAPDSRGHGESGGGIYTFGLKEVEDVRRWVAWIGEQSPGEPVYGLGESMGASILLLAAGKRVPFRAVVAESPFATFPLVARYRMQQRVGWMGSLLAETAMLYARWRHGVDLRDASPIKVMHDINIPVLLVHGTADTHIPMEHSQLLAAANTTCTQLWSPKGCAHTAVLVQEPKEFEKRVLAWFGKTIPDAAPGLLPETPLQRG